MLVAIDPGVSGGIAWKDNDGIVQAAPMPDTQGDIVDHLRFLKSQGNVAAVYLERTGGYMSGNSGPSACKFARGCGFLEGAVMALAMPLIEVAPHNWMKAIGSFPSDKRERKNAIKNLMQARYPHLTITLSTSDALGLLTYALAKKV